MGLRCPPALPVDGASAGKDARPRIGITDQLQADHTGADDDELLRHLLQREGACEVAKLIGRPRAARISQGITLLPF